MPDKFAGRKAMCWAAYSMIWILLCVKGVWCLRMVALHIPPRPVIGDTIRLYCKFDLEGDTLYSIKWYRDDVEFFRFVPRDRPPGQYFPMEGVRVDILNSANSTMILQDVDLTTTGTYKCEVSADAPSFQTESAKKMLEIREASDSDSCSHLRCGLWSVLGVLLTAFFW